MGLINFTDVKKAYNNQEVLQGITFTVERGERVALIGPNGAGKTTLLRIAQGIERADSGTASVARGVKAGFLSQDLAHLEGDENALAWKEVAQMEQKMRKLERDMAEPDANLDELYRAYERLTARYEAIDGYTVEARLKSTLLGLGLRQDALLTPLSLLSSGEKMRAALARILLQSPELLVLDEPTNHLDIRALTWLEDFLIKFEGGVLLISHDRYFLDRVSTRVIELANGSIIEHRGNYSSFQAQKQIRRERALREGEDIDRRIRREKELIQSMRHMRSMSAMHMHEKRLERLEEDRSEHALQKQTAHLVRGRATNLQLGHVVHTSAEIAYAYKLTKKFGERVLLDNASFLVRGSEKVGIIGDNGCGKTTLLNMLLGKDRDFTGECAIGNWVRYTLLDQNSVFADEQRTLIQEVVATRDMEEPEARQELAKVGLYGEEADKRIRVLSGGERVRLKLCCAMLLKPDCLVLDEPTNHLDLPAREAFEMALRDFRGSVIAVSHDRYFLNTSVSRLLSFDNLRIRSFTGNWDAYRAALADGTLAKQPIEDVQPPRKQRQNAAPASPSPGQPSPGKPSPGKPSPAQPSPGKPTPGKPSPGNPSPGKPTPGKPSPGNPSPGKPPSGKPAAPPPSAQPVPAVPAQSTARPVPKPATPQAIAEVKRKLLNVEALIVRLECEKAELEAEFGIGAQNEVFTRYAKVEQDLAELYARWEELAEASGEYHA